MLLKKLFKPMLFLNSMRNFRYIVKAIRFLKVSFLIVYCDCMNNNAKRYEKTLTKLEREVIERLADVAHEAIRNELEEIKAEQNNKED